MRPKRGLHPPIQAERMARLKSSPQELKREEQVCREGRHQGIHSVRTVEGPGWKVRSAGHPFGHGGGWVGKRNSFRCVFTGLMNVEKSSLFKLHSKVPRFRMRKRIFQV